MVDMATRIARAVCLPVTVKTRIGYGPESHMPIVDLARRLEDAGVAMLTVHCRTAMMGHRGAADWSWARRAREVVSIPVVVNGDIRTADDVVRALGETGCGGAMIGRAAIDYPWVFRVGRARLAGMDVPPPTLEERCALYRALVEASVAVRGERAGVASAKRHVGLLGPLLPTVRPNLLRARKLDEALDALACTSR
jgi:tRNA-dihydrouridine synthase